MNKSADDYRDQCGKTDGSGFGLGLFIVVTAASVGLAYVALNNLVSVLGVFAYGPVRAGANSDYYSHILLIPFVSAYFLFEVRDHIRQSARHWPFGAAVIALGLAVFTIALWQRGLLGDNDFASLATAGTILVWGHRQGRTLNYQIDR